MVGFAYAGTTLEISNEFIAPHLNSIYEGGQPLDFYFNTTVFPLTAVISIIDENGTETILSGSQTLHDYSSMPLQFSLQNSFVNGTKYTFVVTYETANETVVSELGEFLFVSKHDLLPI